MTKPSGDLEARVAALARGGELTERLQHGEQDAAAARVLACAAERNL